MGWSDRTTNAGISGIRIFNACQKKNFVPFLEYMTEYYVEEDNIKFLLNEYSNWIATTSIPDYFDEDLKSNSTIFLNAITMNNYLSNVIIMFKDKFESTIPGENPCGLQGLAEFSLRIIVSVSKVGVMWAYLNTPSVGYTVKPLHGSMQLMITGCPILI